MSDVSLFRLYVLRLSFLVIAVGLGMDIWPLLFHHRPWDDVMHGVAVSLLAALSLLALLGVRYPVRMLPLMVFELVWKTIWTLAFALPAWRHNALTGPIRDNVFGIGMGVVVVPLIIPWGHFWRNYVTAPGDRWRSLPRLRPIEPPRHPK